MVVNGDHLEQFLPEALLAAFDAFSTLSPQLLKLGSVHNRTGSVEVSSYLLHVAVVVVGLSKINS